MRTTISNDQAHAYRPCANNCGTYIPSYKQGKYCTHKCSQRAAYLRKKEAKQQQQNPS